jgi:hypothetical protein
MIGFGLETERGEFDVRSNWLLTEVPGWITMHQFAFDVHAAAVIDRREITDVVEQCALTVKSAAAAMP